MAIGPVQSVAVGIFDLLLCVDRAIELVARLGLGPVTGDVVGLLRPAVREDRLVALNDVAQVAQ